MKTIILFLVFLIVISTANANMLVTMREGIEMGWEIYFVLESTNCYDKQFGEWTFMSQFKGDYYENYAFDFINWNIDHGCFDFVRGDIIWVWR